MHDLRRHARLFKTLIPELLYGQACVLRMLSLWNKGVAKLTLQNLRISARHTKTSSQ